MDMLVLILADRSRIVPLYVLACVVEADETGVEVSADCAMVGAGVEERVAGKLRARDKIPESAPRLISNASKVRSTPSFQERGARGCFGRDAATGLLPACLDATGNGDEVDSILRGMLCESCFPEDLN